jgi:hypothetical protein
MPQFIRYDQFPTTVTVGEQKFHPARTVVTDDSLYVFMDSSSGPAKVYEARLDDYGGSGRTRSALTSDGDSVHIAKATGCGCGSLLRGLMPFPGVPMGPQ